MTTPKHRIYTMSFARVYPLYITKAEKKDARKQKSTKSFIGSRDTRKKVWIRT